MQEFQSITGQNLDGRIFTGWDNQRLRSYPSLTTTAIHHPPPPLPPLKCPRCDSLNTKFCYYNNYNLSQPRHFCKSCRRYWTKGGVLRNVPVGGGCRKPKRSSNSKSRAAGRESGRTEMFGKLEDRTVAGDEVAADRGENCGIGWQPAMDAGIFEIAGDNDPANYWSQSQWVDGDHSFFIPSL